MTFSLFCSSQQFDTQFRSDIIILDHQITWISSVWCLWLISNGKSFVMWLLQYVEPKARRLPSFKCVISHSDDIVELNTAARRPLPAAIVMNKYIHSLWKILKSIKDETIRKPRVCQRSNKTHWRPSWWLSNWLRSHTWVGFQPGNILSWLSKHDRHSLQGVHVSDKTFNFWKSNNNHYIFPGLRVFFSASACFLRSLESFLILEFISKS